MSKWGDLSFVLASKKRTLVLKTLKKSNHSPSQLSDILKMPRSHVSIVLKELREKNLIKCLTPKRRKGKIFSITANGKRILDEVNRLSKS